MNKKRNARIRLLLLLIRTQSTAFKSFLHQVRSCVCVWVLKRNSFRHSRVPTFDLITIQWFRNLCHCASRSVFHVRRVTWSGTKRMETRYMARNFKARFFATAEWAGDGPLICLYGSTKVVVTTWLCHTLALNGMCCCTSKQTVELVVVDDGEAWVLRSTISSTPSPFNRPLIEFGIDWYSDKLFVCWGCHFYASQLILSCDAK